MSNYILITALIALAICAVFLFAFERKRPSARDILPIVIMCVIASVGRVIFSFLPGIQPVTAIVIIMGVCYGPQTGFVTGALCALISNVFIGHGPWTPWQMLAWGLIGIIGAGIAHFRWGRKTYVLAAYGVLAGFLYSMIMDIWTVSTLASGLTLPIVLSVYGAGLLYNIGHAIGNAVFIVLLYKPLSKKLLRLRSKYGILEKEIK
ncbi:ECF transporter S component [Parasporobacterium paucivorans]|uniref:Energy-coupling factor transport system substrate-specific component n=1 Tax=Parasporobacterium paucivorans DSM 15970 TaxID=1122934 RepID=A0A1M6DK36_9FIRM|nr:ECF transporter S component [Parasporobacterium paucivorans]SHI73409.1 energy-coupling factor transport system substrate-specific component [Parasporobacterium paucivorans DSM 15970]